MKRPFPIALRASIVITMLVLSAISAFTQPAAEIYWNPRNKADTLIDFGVTLVNYPVKRYFTIRNLSPYDIGVMAVPGQEPYFQVVNTGDVDSQDIRRDEFDEAQVRPYIVKANSLDSFWIMYEADPSGLFPVDVVTEALLKLRVVDVRSPESPSFNKTFLLRGLKTRNILATTTSALFMDSVYVGSSKNLPFTITNASTQRIPIDSFVVKSLQGVTEGLDFKATMDGPYFFSPGPSSKGWSITYMPKDMGPDTVRLVVYYRPNDQAAATDSIACTIYGNGVEQILAIDTVQGDPRDVIVSPDSLTIDFGSVAANGEGEQATIIIGSRGNLDVHYTDESKRLGPSGGAPKDLDAFIIERGLRAGGDGLWRYDDDTLVIRFKPIDGGDHECEYVLTTDLLKRPIFGVPDGKQRYVLLLKGYGLRPQLHMSTLAVDFGRIVLLDGCVSEVERTLTIQNVGNATLRIDDIETAGSVGSVVAQSAQGSVITIQPGRSETITLTYKAAAIGMDTGTLTFKTNALGESVVVQFSADVVPRDTCTVFLDSLAAPPGRVLYVPVRISGPAIASTSRTSFHIGFEPTLLKFKGLLTQGTASAGAVVESATEEPPGQLTVSMSMPATFQENDSLVVLVFDTYLGNRASTELALNKATTMFGNDGCPSVLDVRTRSGAFKLDSLCGLSELAVVPGSNFFTAGVFPNPVSQTATIVVLNAEQRSMNIRVLDAMGRQVLVQPASTVPAGTSLHSLDVSMLPRGTYYLEVSSGYYRHVELMVLQP